MKYKVGTVTPLTGEKSYHIYEEDTTNTVVIVFDKHLADVICYAIEPHDC